MTLRSMLASNYKLNYFGYEKPDEFTNFDHKLVVF